MTQARRSANIGGAQLAATDRAWVAGVELRGDAPDEGRDAPTSFDADRPKIYRDPARVRVGSTYSGSYGYWKVVSTEHIAPGISRFLAESKEYRNGRPEAGFKLSAQRLADVPPALKKLQREHKGWYVDELGSAKVIVSFPDEFAPYEVEHSQCLVYEADREQYLEAIGSYPDELSEDQFHERCWAMLHGIDATERRAWLAAGVDDGTGRTASILRGNDISVEQVRAIADQIAAFVERARRRSGAVSRERVEVSSSIGAGVSYKMTICHVSALPDGTEEHHGISFPVPEELGRWAEQVFGDADGRRHGGYVAFIDKESR